MTRRQRAILHAIATYIDRNGWPPSLRDIQVAAGVSSTSVVAYNLNRLREFGYVERAREISRSIRVTDAGRAALAETQP